MSTRELTYRVAIDTSGARRQAADMRATVARELRQITVGQLDLAAFNMATDYAQQLRAEFDKAADEAQRLGTQVDKIARTKSKGATGGAAGLDINNLFRSAGGLLGGGVGRHNGA